MAQRGNWYSKLSKIEQITLIVLAIGIALRFIITWFVVPSGDSYDHLSTARYIAQNLSIPLFETVYRPFFYYPPFFHILTAGIYKLFSVFGDQIATKSMNFIAPLFGSATLVLFYGLLKKLNLSKKVTLYSIIFLTFIPIEIYYSTIAHVDMAAGFMALLAVYLLHSGYKHRSAIINGLGMLTKYTQLFIFPTLLSQLYHQYKKPKINAINNIAKKSIIFFGITFIIGIPLFIRNIMYLGTPMWPFLNNIFALFGMTPLAAETTIQSSVANLLNAKLPLMAYLSTYGVPLGLPENLFFINIPLAFLTLWGLGTILFTIPFLLGIKTKKSKQVMQLIWPWVITYLIMIVYYTYDAGNLFWRLVIPAFPAFAIIWGYGFNTLTEHITSKKVNAIIVILLIGICTGFAGAEIIKANVAANTWNSHEPVFDWIKNNIPPEAIFVEHSSLLVYNTQTTALSILDNQSNHDPNNLYHYFDPLHTKANPISEYKDWKTLYEDEKTGVKVFKKT